MEQSRLATSTSPLAGEVGFSRFALRKSDLEIRVRGAPLGDIRDQQRGRLRRRVRDRMPSRAQPASTTLRQAAQRGTPHPVSLSSPSARQTKPPPPAPKSDVSDFGNIGCQTRVDPRLVGEGKPYPVLSAK